MLPPSYVLREGGTESEYDASLAKQAIRTFWKELPEGRGDYLEGIRRMHDFLYQRVLSETSAQIFLDKTPRYYLILRELGEIFPDARFILLHRNPLAVLFSVLRTWVGENWFKLAKYRQDLLAGPVRLLEGKTILGDSAVTIQYEDLVQHPREELQTLCSHLDIEFQPEIIEYGSDTPDPWSFGDPESVYQHKRPHTSSLDKWSQPGDAQQWRLLRDYAHALGRETFQALGYDFEECLQKLDASRPGEADLRYTVSLNWLLQDDVNDRGRWERRGLQMLSSVRKKGVMGGAGYLLSRLKSRLS
jgi:hypothetical protein